MANTDETPAAINALAPAITEVTNGDRELRRLRALLLAMMLVETVSVFVPGKSEFRFLPQILIGFVFLALILTLHLASQRKVLREVSMALVAATSYVDRLEQISVVDPATQLFNRRYLDHLFNHQLKWLNRSGKKATLMLLEAFAPASSTAAEEMVIEAAFILRSNFRSSDFVVRYSSARFVVVLPDTDKPEAQIAISRLIDKIDQWNRTNEEKQMALCLALCTYVPNGNIWQCLGELEDRMQDKSDPGIRMLVPHQDTAGLEASLVQ